jgi:hypothetical protein
VRCDRRPEPRPPPNPPPPKSSPPLVLIHMTDRYSLRFETGERKGEVVPIGSARFTIGRRPGNSLQIVENSVSGKHAEFVVDAQGVVLRDLGSTNGTRVGHERALEVRVEGGSQLWIGNVGMTLLDEQAPVSPAPMANGASPADPGNPPSPSGEKGFEVSSEDLERARKGSRSGLLLVVAVGALLGAAGWYFLRGAGAEGRRVTDPVAQIPNNLLQAGYSFESALSKEGAGQASPWVSREGPPASFLESPAAAVSGSVGLRAELGSGEWAAHASQEVRVVPGRVLRVGAVLSSAGGASARVGIELAAATNDDDEAGATAGMLMVWSDAVVDEVERTIVLEASVPTGYRRARVVLLGRADADTVDASAEADDAWLVMNSGGTPTATFDEFKFYALGDPATVAALYRVDHLLVSGLRARAIGSEMGIGTWETVEQEGGLELRPAGLDGPMTLFLRAEEDATAGGVATIGTDGYVRHGVDFERTEVSDLLLGSGLELVRFRFDPPVNIKGRSVGTAFAISCDLQRPSAIVLQLKFGAELAAAANLAHDAEQAEADGQLGLCITKWQELLDSYPFDERRVARAEETRGRLVLAGLAEVRSLSAQVERARFFRLIDLYRECLRDSTDLAQRFVGSEVEPEARRLASELGAEIALLEVDLDRDEKARLEGVLRTLDLEGAELLAAQVRSYLAEQFGQTSGAAPGSADGGGQ